MASRTNVSRTTIGALLGATALHLALIASATAWLAVSAGPDRRDPVLTVALYRTATTAAAPASRPAAPANGTALPARRQAVRQPQAHPRPPAVAHRFAAAATVVALQQIASPEPSATQSHTPDSPPAPALATPPIAAKTGVTIPAAYAAGNRKPAYPLLSRRYHEQGTAVLRVLVNAGGTADETHIKKSSGYPLLDQAALSAVRNWRFAPATQDGKPITEWYEISIPYILRD